MAQRKGLAWAESCYFFSLPADSAVILEIDHDKKTVWEEVIKLQ